MLFNLQVDDELGVPALGSCEDTVVPGVDVSVGVAQVRVGEDTAIQEEVLDLDWEVEVVKLVDEEERGGMVLNGRVGDVKSPRFELVVEGAQV